MKHVFCGLHLISDFCGITRRLEAKKLLSIIYKSSIKNNLTVVDTGIHQFDNGGFTIYCLLAESHISIHYYVEVNSAFIDVFTCGHNNPSPVLDDLKCYCMPTEEKNYRIERGKTDAR